MFFDCRLNYLVYFLYMGFDFWILHLKEIDYQSLLSDKSTEKLNQVYNSLEMKCAFL